MKQLITRKIGMSSTIAENGVVTAVTMLSVPKQVVTQIKTIDKDGYNAVQVGGQETKKASKPLMGHVKKAKFLPKIIREYRIIENNNEINVGDELNLDIFSVGDKINVTAVSKGKGFAGTIKRHNFHRGRKTHGGRSYRRPGSIGSMYPQRIFKGKKMAGRMGHDQVTVKNLTIDFIDNEKNVIGVTGAVPGPRKAIVLLKGVK